MQVPQTFISWQQGVLGFPLLLIPNDCWYSVACAYNDVYRARTAFSTSAADQCSCYHSAAQGSFVVFDTQYHFFLLGTLTVVSKLSNPFSHPLQKAVNSGGPSSTPGMTSTMKCGPLFPSFNQLFSLLPLIPVISFLSGIFTMDFSNVLWRCKQATFMQVSYVLLEAFKNLIKVQLP